MTSTPVKSEESQAKAKDLALRGLATGYIMEAITSKTQKHYFSLIMGIGTNLGGNTLKGKITCRCIRSSMLYVGLLNTKDVQHRQKLEN